LFFLFFDEKFMVSGKNPVFFGMRYIRRYITKANQEQMIMTHEDQKAIVHVVGTRPGDHGLLTLKADALFLKMSSATGVFLKLVI
jgi:hypothetical protein